MTTTSGSVMEVSQRIHIYGFGSIESIAADRRLPRQHHCRTSIFPFVNIQLREKRERSETWHSHCIM